MTDIGEIVGVVFAAFFAIVMIAVLAPVVGELGGGWYEAAFVLMAFLVVVAGVLGISKR